MSELPDGAAIEPVFLIEASYGPDAAELRAPVRGEHLARVARLRDEGVVIEAGGLTDMSGSVFIVRAADAAAARAIAEADVYVRAGVWVEIRVRPMGRVCRPDELPSA